MFCDFGGMPSFHSNHMREVNPLTFVDSRSINQMKRVTEWEDGWPSVVVCVRLPAVNGCH